MAVVGCGAIAEMGHIPAAIQVDEAQLVALVDTDRARAETLAEQFGVPKAVCSLREVANEIDAVILATPPHVRPVLAEQAFGAGLHVLCEKPLANSSAECRAILAASEQAGRVLAVAHTYRFFPNRIHVYSLLQQKALGMVNTVKVEQGDPADWPTRTGYTFRHEMVAGGVLVNEGIHSLDALFWWFGYPLDFEYEDDAIGGLESNVRIKLRFKDDITGTFRLSRTCKLENRMVITGELGNMSLPIYNQTQVSLSRNGQTVTQTLVPRSGGFLDMVAEQLRDFVMSIETKRPPRVTGADGLRVVEFIEMCYALKRCRPLPKRAPIPGLTW
jgi:predicted dehydrogenase